MDSDIFFDIVRKRRSVRTFKPDPIPDGYVEKILDAARWAMSGANGQPWEFVVVKDKDLRQKIADIYRDTRIHTRVIEESRVKDLQHTVLTHFEREPGFKDAPVLIVVCADPRTFQATVLCAHFYAGEGGPMATFYKNMANVTQLICLSAAALGVGSMWISVNGTWEPQLKALLGVPQMLTIQTIVPLGYPARKVPGPYRRKLSEIVHYDRYDQSRFRTDEQIQEWLRDLRRRAAPLYQAELSS